MRIALLATLTAATVGLVDSRPASANYTCVGAEWPSAGALALALRPRPLARPGLRRRRGCRSPTTSRAGRAGQDRAPRGRHRRRRRLVAPVGCRLLLLATATRGVRRLVQPERMTAAHKTLPFGTKVRVTHAGTGRSVLVTINDRGPYIAGRDRPVPRRGLVARDGGRRRRPRQSRRRRPLIQADCCTLPRAAGLWPRRPLPLLRSTNRLARIGTASRCVSRRWISTSAPPGDRACSRAARAWRGRSLPVPSLFQRTGSQAGGPWSCGSQRSPRPARRGCLACAPSPRAPADRISSPRSGGRRGRLPDASDRGTRSMAWPRSTGRARRPPRARPSTAAP